MRINQVFLEPGEVTESHTHPGHEEVFYAQTAGQIAIDGDVHDGPAGGLVRVREDVPRNLLNRDDQRQVWLAIGAPPVGSVEDFGAFEREDANQGLDYPDAKML